MHFQNHSPNQPIIIIAHRYATGANEPMHKHACHQLIVIKHGFMRVTTSSGHFAITQNRGIWLAEGTEHSLTILKNTHVIAGFIEPLARADLSNRSQVVSISDLLQALLENSIGINSQYQSHTREAWLVELMLDECRRLTPLTEFALPEPTVTAYKTACDKIRERLHHGWSLTDMAQILGISERTVSRQFTQQTGLSFAEWLRRLRLQHSLELLLSGQSVVDVALSVGYDSPSAFSTAFKQRIGLSPTQYVAQYQKI